MGLLAAVAAGTGAAGEKKEEGPQPDYAALGLLDDEEMDVEEKKDDGDKGALVGVDGYNVTEGIVVPYRTRRLTKHLDLMWRRTAGETYDFEPIKVRNTYRSINFKSMSTEFE